jgi:hypothetical protein
MKKTLVLTFLLLGLTSFMFGFSRTILYADDYVEARNYVTANQMWAITLNASVLNITTTNVDVWVTDSVTAVSFTDGTATLESGGLTGLTSLSLVGTATVNGRVSVSGNIVGAGLVANSIQWVSPNSGSTVNITSNISNLILHPAATTATLNVVLPTAPIDGQTLCISSTEIITELNISVASGTINNAPTTFAAAPGKVRFIYRLADTSWYVID